jgi:hypothetical protein
MRTGFEKDHVPLKTLPRMVKKGPMLMSVWSFKTNTPYIALLGSLTGDAMTHFEANPAIESISSYPTELPLRDKDGVLTGDLYVPQLGVRYHPERGENQGRIVYFDVIPYHLQLKMNGLKHRTPMLKEAFADAFNAGYGVIDERSILVEPRFSNLSTICWHLKCNVEKWKQKVREALMDLPVPTTIASVRRACSFASPWYEVGEPGRITFREQLTDIDYAFTSLMQLAAAGEVDLDISRPINGDTRVTWGQRRGGHR